MKLFSNSIKTDISKWKWTHDVVVIFARHPASFGNLTSPMLKDSGEKGSTVLAEVGIVILREAAEGTVGSQAPPH